MNDIHIETVHHADGAIEARFCRADGREIASLTVRRVVKSLQGLELYRVRREFSYETEPQAPNTRVSPKYETAIMQPQESDAAAVL